MAYSEESTTMPIWRRQARLSPATVALVVGLALPMFWLGGLVGIGSQAQVDRADSTADLIVATAFVQGIDPYTDLYELSEQLEISYANAIEEPEQDLVHPRTPGAILLTVPFVVVSADQFLYLAVGLGGVAVVVSSLALGFYERLSWGALVALLAYGLMSGPARWGLAFGTSSALLWALVVLYGLAVLQRKQVWAGVALALVGTLKLFPLLLGLVLVRLRMWRSIALAVAVFLALNLTPLLWPHVTVEGFYSAVQSSVGNWFRLPGNIGLTAALDDIFASGHGTGLLIQLVMVALAIGFTLTRKVPITWALVVCSVVGVLGSPLAWPHYLLMVAPWVIVVIDRDPPGWAANVALGVGLLLTLPLDGVRIHTFGLVVVLVAILVGMPRAKQSSLIGDRSIQRTTNMALK